MCEARVSDLADLIWALAALGIVGLLIALAVHYLSRATPSDLQDAYDDTDDDTRERIEDAGDSVSNESADAADERVRDHAERLGVDTGDGVGEPDTTVDDIIRDIDFDEDV